MLYENFEFRDLIKNSENISEAEEIAALNSTGENYWLIGGMVYRTINWQVRGVPISGVLKKETDIDILFEGLRDDLILVGGYEASRTSYGGVRLNRDDVQIDMPRLSEVSYFKRSGVEPSIENYLDGAFTDIQSSAFNLVSDEFIDGGTMDAFKRGSIRVRNRSELENYCKIKKITPEYYLDRLAKSLDIGIE